MSEFYVYVLFHPETGAPFYVGKGCKNRLNAHKTDLRGNADRAKIIRSALEKGLDIPAIKVSEGLSEIEAFRREEAYIVAIGRKPEGPLVNKNDGGVGRRHPDPEVRARIAEAARIASTGRRHTAETRAKMRASANGRRPSAKCHEALVKARTGKKLDPEFAIQRAAWKKGRPHSPEHVAAIKKALAGKAPSSATVEGRHRWLAAKMAAKSDRQCPICQSIFRPKRSAQMFCCMSCSGTYNRAKRKNVS